MVFGAVQKPLSFSIQKIQNIVFVLLAIIARSPLVPSGAELGQIAIASGIDGAC